MPACCANWPNVGNFPFSAALVAALAVVNTRDPIANRTTWLLSTATVVTARSPLSASDIAPMPTSVLTIDVAISSATSCRWWAAARKFSRSSTRVKAPCT
jgi:hypothetical protein